MGARILGLLALLAALVPGSARATLAASVAGEFAPVAVVRQGDPLLYANLDTAIHNLIARDERPDASMPFCADYDPGACPLFWTPLLERGGVAPVEGLGDVRVGETYAFFCELHPGMGGALRVI